MRILVIATALALSATGLPASPRYSEPVRDIQFEFEVDSRPVFVRVKVIGQPPKETIASFALQDGETTVEVPSEVFEGLRNITFSQLDPKHLQLFSLTPEEIGVQSFAQSAELLCVQIGALDQHGNPRPSFQLFFEGATLVYAVVDRRRDELGTGCEVYDSRYDPLCKDGVLVEAPSSN